MPITRSELRKQREINQKSATEGLIKNMFHSVCSEVTICNSYGTTTHKVNLKYSAYWSQPLVDRVVEMLQAHYIDSHIWTCDKAIMIEWTFADHFSDGDIAADSAANSVIDVNRSNVDEDIQINISFPSRVTRSSSRR